MYSVISNESDLIITPVVQISKEKSSSMYISKSLEDPKVEIKDSCVMPLMGDISPSSEVHIIYGILGIMRFKKGTYLVAIKKEKFLCEISGSKIYQLERIQTFPLYDNTDILLANSKNGEEDEEDSEQEDEGEFEEEEETKAKKKSRAKSRQPFFNEDLRYIKMLKYLLRSANFFFYTKGGTYNLTKSFKDQEGGEYEADYVWNWEWMEETYRKSSLFVKLIQGSISFFSHKVRQTNSQVWKKLKVFLISRRNKKMSGTRFNARGVDKHGNVSNFVESEHIIELDDLSPKGGTDPKIFSFVLLRGSIPLIWSQSVNMDYHPPIDFSKISSEESKKAFKIHFDNIFKKYSKIVCVDLTRSKGNEGKLKMQYEKNVKELNLPSLNYVSFDIFKVCGMVNIKFKKLAKLKEKTQEYLSANTYNSPISKSVQESVLRINCKESLDRTNIIQTFFIKDFTQKILKEVGLLQEEGKLRNVQEFDKKLKYSLGENGDRISKFYAGSGALKTDSLKQKKKGGGPVMAFVNDAMKNIIRYYQNNLNDGYKQDCIDLLTKNYTSLDTATNRKEKVFCLFNVIFFFFLLFKPEASSRRRSSIGRFLIIFWLIIFILFWKLSFQSGKKFVNRPKLRRWK